MGSPFAMKHRRNPMSMALHSSLAPCEIPQAESLRDKASKVGQLKKLSGKGILTSGTWRERFCLLVKSKLYYYESEDSTGTEKSCGFVNLEYFDTCTEASTRMARKATNVFVIGSSDKGFFESHSGRHYFAAETLPEMKEWVNAINSAMKNHIRTKEKRTRDGSLTPGQTKRDSSKMKSKEDDSPTGTLPRSSARLDHVTKGRVRGPQGRRLPRKPQKIIGPDSKSDAIDSLVDSDEDSIVRDSRGRATSLSALEASSETHPKVSEKLEKEEKRSRSQNQSEVENTAETWDSLRTGETDGIDTPDMDLIYHYSTSEDSDDDDDTSLSLRKSGGLGKNYVQKRPQSRPGSRLGGNAIRNSSVTPPPCILRKYRRDQVNNNGVSNGPTKNEIKAREKAREESPSPLLPEFDNKPQRTSSGSSLSTLTADTYSHISNSSFGLFSSLQRKKSRLPASSGCNGNGITNPTQLQQHNPRNSTFQHQRQSASANASPLMNGSASNGFQNHNGHNNNSNNIHRNGYASHNNSPSNTFDRNSYVGVGQGFQIERNLYSLTKELESVTQETKQLDADVTGLRQDVGTVQENVVTVRGAVDITRDRVNKLQTHVSNVERQIASLIQEASSMRDEAIELLESAKNAKEMQSNLLEEAQALVAFLRQSSSCMPSSPYLHQHQHSFGHYQPNCCSPSPIPPYFGHQLQHTQQHNNVQMSLTRRQGKTPERSLNTEEADMETLDESVLPQIHQNGYFDSLATKNRKSKSIQSTTSSGSSSSASNRASVIEPLDRKPGSKSPNNSDAKSNENPVKISHL